MWIVTHRKIFYILSVIIIAISLGALLLWGLQFGIDFKGGSLIEVGYPAGRPDVEAVRAELANLKLTELSVRPTGDDGFIVRTPFLSDVEHQALLSALSQDGKVAVTEKQFTAIGPTLSSELVNKAILSLGLVILAIVAFITFVFRKVSKPVSSWKYGLVTVAALLHDIVVPIGAFAILGNFLGYEVDTLFVTALLVILGFSVHDTIVVFDRVRENLRRELESGVRKTAPFEETVGKSVRQTFNRSINTSLTTLLAITALYFLGPEATRHFALALLIGIATGTYSSIFIASPLLVTLERRNAKRT